MKQKVQFLLILMLLTSASVSLNAQKNSSYMGNRVLFNFGTTFSPSWLYPNFFKNSNHWKKYYSFNYDITPSIEIITHRKGSVGAVYHYFETKFEYPAAEWIDNNAKNVGDITTHGFGILYKQYVGSVSRAPFGTYLKFQFDGFFYNAIYTQPNEQMAKGYQFATKIALGHDFLFFDRLRVSTAFSLGIPLNNWKGMWSTLDLSYHSYTNDNKIQDYINSRIMGMYLFGFEVNIGILLF